MIEVIATAVLLIILIAFLVELFDGEPRRNDEWDGLE